MTNTEKARKRKNYTIREICILKDAFEQHTMTIRIYRCMHRDTFTIQEKINFQGEEYPVTKKYLYNEETDEETQIRGWKIKMPKHDIVIHLIVQKEI